MAEEGGAASPQEEEEEEERPEWLPEGWTVVTKARKTGKVDRYYTSELAGKRLRSKAKVIRYANKHNPPDVSLGENHFSESDDLQEAHFALPDGWAVETRFRKGGVNPGASYKIYFDPITGFKCYSMKDVFRYVTGREPRRGTKKRAGLRSPDSVLTQFEGSSKRHLDLDASRPKKNKRPIAAATQIRSTVRRSLFGSPALSFNGFAELSLEDPFFHNCNISSNGCVDAAECIDVCDIGGVDSFFEDQPCYQNEYPRESRDETGKISNSIDEFIRYLSNDFKIPDINIAYTASIEQGGSNLASNIAAGIDIGSTVVRPTEQFAVSNCETNESHQLSESLHSMQSKSNLASNIAAGMDIGSIVVQPTKQFAVNNCETNETHRLSESPHSMQSKVSGIKQENLLLREPWETAKEGLPFEDMEDKTQNTPCEQKKTVETNSTGQLPKKPDGHKEEDSNVTDKKDELDGKSCGEAVEIAKKTSVDMVPEETNETRPSKIISEWKRTREDQTAARSGTLSTRDRKGRYKTAIIAFPSRTSRRLAGLVAGPDAYVDINEYALRRNKRLAKERANPSEPNRESLPKADEECIVSQCPENASNMKEHISTPEQECIVAQCPEDKSTLTASISTPQSDAKDKHNSEQDPIITKDDLITIKQHEPFSAKLEEEDPRYDPKTSLFGEAFLDPCLQFAFKTLTGDLPIFDVPEATGGLFKQQMCPVKYSSMARKETHTRPLNNGSMGRREIYPTRYHAPNGYAHSATHGFYRPCTPFPNDRVLNLNFATGTITKLMPFKYDFHSDTQPKKGPNRAK